MDAPIFKIDEFDEEKFKRWKERTDTAKLQNRCYHGDDIIFDGEVDELVCSKCKKKWSSFEFLWYWVDKKSHPKLKVWEIENNIHFLEQEKLKLEEEVASLKSEKRKLRREINKTK